MRFLTVLLTLALAISATGCFKDKKKELSEWQRYKANAEAAIESLRKLEEFSLGDLSSDRYKTALEATNKVVEQFLQDSQPHQEKASRKEIVSAVQDFQLSLELATRRKSNTATGFASDKLFASTDAELFTRVKQKYQLGPELVISKQPYYFIEPIIHEAWRSAGYHIDRAVKRLEEESAAEAKAAREAKKKRTQNSVK